MGELDPMTLITLIWGGGGGFFMKMWGLGSDKKIHNIFN